MPAATRPVGRRTWCGLVLLLVAAALALAAIDRVGPLPNGGTRVPTGQTVRPAGEVVAFAGRPVDMALSPDGEHAYVKDNRGVVVIAAATWKVTQELPFPKDKGGGSMHGLALSRDGKRLFATTATQWLCEAEVLAGGRLKWARAVELPGPGGKGPSHPTGLALTGDGKHAWVCQSRNNSLALVDLAAARRVAELPVGVAPYAVVLAGDEKTAFVSNWGGRHPKKGERAAPSAGTPTLVDARGVAASGTVARVDLVARAMREQVETGLHPSALVLSPNGALYVANANSDTVAVLKSANLEVVQRLSVRPDDALPFGSAPNALALSADGKTLYCANGGNNAVAVLDTTGPAARPLSRRGFVPAGWYPGAVAVGGKHVYIANVKGEGSRLKGDKAPAFGVYGYKGTVQRVPFPDARQLAGWAKQVRDDARLPQALAALQRGRKGGKPAPVPARVGEPSVFEHVIYVIKENRTYDQVFGDLEQGKGDPKLCLFGREVTPNHHALAEQFVLLDNFYCNGVLSADGHSWATEGHVSDHLEKSFGGFTRSYTFGDDPLTYSSTGFIWDGVLLAGLSFRNYGEMRVSDADPDKSSFSDLYKDYRSGKPQIKLKHTLGLEPLARYTCPDYPGWNMKITDQQRIDVFLRELAGFEKGGGLPNFTIVYLPQDHCSGSAPGLPTPRAHMADNDLALGRLVEAVSRSRFWKKAAIFVIEDDPQDGFDHVDGHRSVCLVVSPYTRRKQVVSSFYNQTSVLHTMARILGLPAMNQLDAQSPVMADCFTATPDFTPYKALPAKFALDEVNKPLKDLKGKARDNAAASARQDLSRPDRVNDDAFNRVLWHAVRGDEAAYPAAWAGAHGRGLKARGLRLEGGAVRP